MTQRFARVACAFGVVVAAGAIARAQTSQPATPANASQSAPAQAASPKLAFSGDLALWTVAIKPDKTADFEKVMARLHEALTTSSNPDRQKRRWDGRS